MLSGVFIVKSSSDNFIFRAVLVISIYVIYYFPTELNEEYFQLAIQKFEKSTRRSIDPISLTIYL